MSVPTINHREIPHCLKATNTAAPANTLLIRIQPPGKHYFPPLSCKFTKTVYFNFSETERVKISGAFTGEPLIALTVLLIDCFKAGTSVVVMSHGHGTLARTVVRAAVVLGFDTADTSKGVNDVLCKRLKDTLHSYTKGAKRKNCVLNERVPRLYPAHCVLEETALTSA